jgi:hypothetical protein
METHGPGDPRQLSDEQLAADAFFKERFDRFIAPMVDVHFYANIVGVKHLNRDGSRRSTLVNKCEVLDFLNIEAEPDNPVDPKAVAVKTQAGLQLGYLPARTAHEIYSDLGKPEFNWIGVFVSANRHPETNRAVGAVIVLARMTAEQTSAFVAESDH